MKKIRKSGNENVLLKNSMNILIVYMMGVTSFQMIIDFVVDVKNLLVHAVIRMIEIVF